MPALPRSMAASPSTPATDTIVVTIPAAKAAGGKLFGRLSAVQAP
ncbi:hypothetical protein OKA05_10950 [Luteolibacter arcticus]|uniref:Uncharacterized protein n=1 Tax=Luteolibacter arcticus TaxID=1581411 RepID=A0ABT3GHU3_9BACT|nr:hypothetical protein [Luteolibacter arcticus]MCW1923071.1 hypothetical protein [Luteolibacter arcticus]